MAQAIQLPGFLGTLAILCACFLAACNAPQPPVTDAASQSADAAAAESASGDAADADGVPSGDANGAELADAVAEVAPDAGPPAPDTSPPADSDSQGSGEIAGGLPSVCKPGSTLLWHEAAYDAKCAGNLGCTTKICVACETSCTKCDGPYCVEVTNDDSCLVGWPQIQSWAPEPAVALPLVATEAQLATVKYSYSNLLILESPPNSPTQMQWQPPGGAVQQADLQLPVKVLADLGLVFGKGSAVNFCTGDKKESSVGPGVFPVVETEPKPTLEIWLSPGLGWAVQVAWLRVYEDAAGQRSVQWLQLAGSLGGATTTAVTYPFPLSAATPIVLNGKPFDWPAAVTAALP